MTTACKPEEKFTSERKQKRARWKEHLAQQKIDQTNRREKETSLGVGC